MTPAPFLSIVVPVFNDAGTIAAALESCLAQTLAEIEVVCVDDASTDASAAVVESIARRDPRVRLIRQPENLSAFQARRAGTIEARGEYVLFLDGDDELAPKAAKTTLDRARATGADLVGFGVTVIGADGRTGGRYEQKLQPTHSALKGSDVLAGLFPLGEPAQGQLWRYLFRRSILREAYELLPADLILTRVNDLPLMFMVAAFATSYVSTPERLYRYHLGRGGSGHGVDSLERAQFYTGAITSIDSIAPAVARLAAVVGGDLIQPTYDSVRQWVIAYVSHQLLGRGNSMVLDEAVAHLYTRASERDIVRAVTQHFPETLSTLRFHAPRKGFGDRSPRSALLATSSLGTGGVSAVIQAQARYLQGAGMRVTLVARKPGSDRTLVPEGVTFAELSGRGLAEQLREWADLCRAHEIDVVIDHQVLYTTHWPEFALVARAEGAATIGWVHNFVGRPVYDGTDRLSIIERCAGTLTRVVVLSPLDVAYLKLRGIPHALFAPNPPSTLLLEATPASPKPEPSGRLELVWWGRLEERTKKVSELIEIADHLRDLGVPFRLTIIGPGWNETTPEKLSKVARKRGLGEYVAVVGPLHGSFLRAAIDAAHAFVSMSIIEGYQLTIAEAQSRGLPVFMYDLPWLTLVRDNAGVVTSPQGDARALALRIAEVARDPDRFRALSDASRAAAERAVAPDFAVLYRDIVTGVVPAGSSPEPTLEDARELLELMQFYAARTLSAPAARRAGVGERVWRSAEPAGRAVLRTVPGLRPLAHRAKRWVTGR